MEYIADLHLHSKYAMACSEQLTLEGIDAEAKEKGIKVVSTGDFTHPRWAAELKDKLGEKGEGIFALKGSSSGTRFILGSEVCTIFKDRLGKTRRIHNCMLAPSIEVVEQINDSLSKFGELGSDGRSILNGLSPAELVERLISIDKGIFVFPAHLWTPWFGALGAFSGFNSIEEAYGDQAKHIHAYETGLSSDPAMNWTISKLDKYAMLSGSDAHSLPKIGREAVIFDFDSAEPDYAGIIGKIKSKDIRMTVEFYPEEGKYHFDGHRNCSISLSPEEAAKYNDRCPKCGKRLTIGVLHRVHDLADREPGARPAGAVPYVHAIPLIEVIAYVSKKSATTAYVKSTYFKMIQKFGTEFNVLLKADVGRIAEVDAGFAKAINIIREDRANVVPGYDGVFGIVDIFNEVKARKDEGVQKRMCDFK